MNAWKKILLAITVLLCLCVSVLVMFVQSRNSSWLRYCAELEAKGEPLTFAAIQAKRSPQPGKNTIAEVVTRVADAVQKTQSRIPHGIYGLRDGPKINFFDGLDVDTIELSREYLISRLPILEELDVIESLEPGRFALDYDRPAMDIFSMRHRDKLPPIRPVAKLLYLHATLQLVDGKIDSAVQFIPKLLNVVSPLVDEPSTTDHFTHISAADKAILTLENILRITAISDVSLRQIDISLARYISSHSVTWALWGVRALIIGLCDDHIKTGTGAAGVATSAGLIIERQQGTDLLTQLIDASNDPVSLWTENKSVKKKGLLIPKTRYFTRKYMPSMYASVELHLRCLAKMHATRMAIAAERFRMVEGKLPDSLEQLVPLYLSEIPIDPFDGLPMKLSKNDVGIIIYSVAADEIDQGGLVAHGKKHDRALDCGFRLLDFDKRGLIILEGVDDK